MKARLSFFLNASAIALFILAFSTLATAQATRTWVSGVGDDVNPCSRTAPCKTFAGAISKTAAGGEIDALDPGGFGAVTITKSITIDGEGTMASILNSGTTGININITTAGEPGVVILRNLSINGAGASPGLRGITITSAKKVVIENCIIQNQQAAGSGRGISDVRVGNLGGVTLQVINTTIVNSNQSNVVINPAAGTTVNAAFQNVRLLSSSANSGIAVSSGANVNIKSSVISGNATNGVFAEELTGSVDVNIDDTIITNNGTGVNNFTAGPIIRLANVFVTGNNTGLSGSSIFSYGNNKINGNNAGNGPPSGGLIPQQ